jgi:hypothetical protein
MADDLSRYAEDGVTRDLRGQKHRFPLINCEWPRWNYITAIVIGDDSDRDIYGSPTDDEIAMVGSFHDQYIDYWYRLGWLNHMREKHPFDVDGGANGRFLCKYKHGGWGIKTRTWEHGARPQFRDEPMTLVQVMDRHFRIGTEYPDQKWNDWKAAHPEMFGSAS